ncbi:MAG: ABC transporter ATP-binding protein [Methanosarcina sp.]|nr:ABC transporter ATP-binding protein [Methanosarcina sp.]
MEFLEIKGIKASYGKKEVLRGLSFSLKKGEILAIIGPNGAGKSTLLKVISGFLKPTEGKVMFEGKDIIAIPAHRRAGLGIGYFIQGGKVFPSLTVRENLELGGTGLDTETRKNRTESVLGMFYNLKSLLERRAGLLSGGERQAVAMAMMLVRNPKLLLLDEPSAGLSPRIAGDMLGRIKDINEKWGVSIIVVEQNVGQALKIARKVLVLVSGQIALESEESSKLLEGAGLEELFLGKGY